jgi:hypothetical protein
MRLYFGCISGLMVKQCIVLQIDVGVSKMKRGV